MLPLLTLTSVGQQYTGTGDEEVHLVVRLASSGEELPGGGMIRPRGV